MKQAAILTMYAMFALFSVSSAKATAIVVLGAHAPDFQGTDAQGKIVNLHDFENKIVVLEWTSPVCPYSQMHYETLVMQQTQDFVKKSDGIWLTVTSDAAGESGFMTPDLARTFMNEKQANPTVMILDVDGRIGKLFNAKATPYIAILDKEHRLVYAGAFDSNVMLRETTEPVKNYVRETLDDLQNNRPIRMPATRAYGCPIHYENKIKREN